MIECLKHILRGEYPIPSALIDHHLPMVEAQAERIFESSSRSFSDILQNCLDGTAAELGCMGPCNETDVSGNGHLNPKIFDKRDPDSFAWDFGATIFEDGDIDSPKPFRAEVKSVKSRVDIEFFRFNVNPQGKRGLDLTTFLKHGVSRTNFLIISCVDFDEDTLDYTSFPKYILESKHFAQYVEVNKKNDGNLSHFVNLPKMIAAGHAVHIQ